MEPFAEHLADWEFDDKWRPIVQRLHERTRTWPTELLAPDDFWIYDAWDIGEHGQLASTGGLLIWTDLANHGSIALTLGARVDDRGLRCGSITPSRPDDPTDADLTWFTRPIRLDALEQTADELLDWFALEATRWHNRLAGA